METLTVDCGSCRARGPACGDCLMTALMGPLDDEVRLSGEEQGALQALTASGLLPPLRLVLPVARTSRQPSLESQDGVARAQALP